MNIELEVAKKFMSGELLTEKEHAIIIDVAKLCDKLPSCDECCPFYYSHKESAHMDFYCTEFFVKYVIARGKPDYNKSMDVYKYKNLLKDAMFTIDDMLFAKAYFDNISTDEFVEAMKKLSGYLKKIRSVDKLDFD